MKISTVLNLLSSAALLIFATIGCKTMNETERPQMSTVIAMSGHAECWNDRSNKVYTIKVGDRLPPGLTIRTGSEEGNYVDLATGEQIRFLNANRLPDFNPFLNYVTYDPADSMRICPNSILKLSKVTLKIAGKSRIPNIGLVLLQGSVLFCAPSASVSKTNPARLQSYKPYHEIRSSNVVVRAEHGTLFSSASGLVQIIRGAATVECPDKGFTKDLVAEQQYDSTTGEISLIENYNTLNRMFTWPGEGWHTLGPPPRMQAFEMPPRRPF